MPDNHLDVQPTDTAIQGDHDDILIRLVASALFRLAESAERGETLSAPYPRLLQRALDRLAVTCLLRGHNPPQSVPDLFAWCRRPLVEWPVSLPDNSCGNQDTLLDGSRITNLCDEWAEHNVMDVEAELSQRKIITDVRKICHSLEQQQSYVAFRRMLIEKSVITQLELQQAMIEADLAPLGDRLKSCYIEAPACHQDKGEYRCCLVCGGLLLRSQRDDFVCENERCRVNGEFVTGNRLKAEQGVLWLRREFRRFIVAPGIAELRLHQKLSEIEGNLELELWPAFDNYDILTRFPDGEVWAVDVKDQANPYLLAIKAVAPPDDPHWDRAFFVFPDHRRREQPDYMRAFKNHTKVLAGRVEAAFEAEFVARVKRKLRSKQKCETPVTGGKA